MDLSTIDIVIIVLIGISAIHGLFKGLIMSAASLIALIVGVWAALKFSYLTGAKLEEWFTLNAKITTVVAFTLTFVLAVFGVHLLGKILSSAVNCVSLGWLDKILGLLFGALKCVLLISIVISILESFDYLAQNLLSEAQDSLMYSIVKESGQTILNQLNFNNMVDAVKGVEL